MARQLCCCRPARASLRREKGTMEHPRTKRPGRCILDSREAASRGRVARVRGPAGKEGRKRVPAGKRKRVPARPVPPEVTVPTRESPGRAGRCPRPLPRPLAAVSPVTAGGDGRASEPPRSALRAGLGIRFPCQLRAAPSRSANSELPD